MVTMTRVTKVENADSARGQNMAEIGAKNRFETASGTNNGDVRTEIRQDECAWACTNLTGPTGDQESGSNESSTAKVSSNLGSRNSDQGNVEKNEQMTSEMKICNVKPEKCRKGYEE